MLFFTSCFPKVVFVSRMLNVWNVSFLQQVAYESCKPLGAWVDNLAKRVDFFSSWLDLARQEKSSKSRMSRESGMTSTPTPSQSSMSVSPPRDHPNAFWLPAFFFPQGNLNGSSVTVVTSWGKLASISFNLLLWVRLNLSRNHHHSCSLWLI